jgi:hypothetical protein
MFPEQSRHPERREGLILAMAERIRVTLRWIQILDNLEPFFEARGEFRFIARVTADGHVQETQFPKEGYYEISDHPDWNRIRLDRSVYAGPVERRLVVELMGEELDALSANDRLVHYRREFVGSPSDWVGEYGPGKADNGDTGTDPESMRNWIVSYLIERA